MRRRRRCHPANPASPFVSGVPNRNRTTGPSAELSVLLDRSTKSLLDSAMSDRRVGSIPNLGIWRTHTAFRKKAALNSGENAVTNSTKAPLPDHFSPPREGIGAL